MISAHTRVIAVIGDPISHSITPRIQNFAWQKIGADIVNIALRVAPENLAEAVRGARAQGMLGLMVTIPHKERVLALCDELDESAQAMGAANLLHFQSDGKIVGYSTDGWAAIESLREENVAVSGARILILGGGGAARSLAISFAQAGAREIIIANRTVERAVNIAAESAIFGASTRAISLQESALLQALRGCDLLVNATSIGMTPDTDQTPLDAELLARVLAARDDFAVYDIVYNPLQTRLLREAKECGARVVDGLGMLIYTNVRAAKICVGLDISAALMRAEALRALGK